VALVIGSAHNIGAATAKALSQRGAAVVLADIDLEGSEQRAHEIRAAGGTAMAIGCDVCDEDQVAATVRFTLAQFGQVDILHNNAAATQLIAADLDVLQASSGHWDSTLATNLRGTMLACKYALVPMLERGNGAIVNTTSASASWGEPMLSAYGASKAAVEQLTRAVATQYGKRGIRCNAIAPGLVRSDRPGKGLLPETIAKYERHHLTPYIGEPEDIANAVAFLASDEARFITGHVLRVDGGFTAHSAPYADLM
jgi:NAD(P)-dependent dehydrogenase (short-subunit alcohol dehydrogenase family)